MKTLAVHPAVMKRIIAGGSCTLATRYELECGEVIEVVSDDEVVSVKTKVLRVESRGCGLFFVELDDPATAFVTEEKGKCYEDEE